MKKIIFSVVVVLACCVNLSGYGLDCSQVPAKAPLYSDPTFPGIFEDISACQCEAHGLPKKFCEGTGERPYNVAGLYKMMINFSGSLAKACDGQSITDPATCVADWQCFCTGKLGQDPGANCSGTTYCQST